MRWGVDGLQPRGTLTINLEIFDGHKLRIRGVVLGERYGLLEVEVEGVVVDSGSWWWRWWS